MVLSDGQAFAPGVEADEAYHIRRARTELDAAFSAKKGASGSAHLMLCSLHMRHARAAAQKHQAWAFRELIWLEALHEFYRECLEIYPGVRV